MAQIWAGISKTPLIISISQVNIIESNQNVQFQTNRASQNQDISEKPNFGPKLGLNGPNLGPNSFSIYFITLTS